MRQPHFLPSKHGGTSPLKGEEKTVAGLQFNMLYHYPYQFTSGDVLFQAFTQKQKNKKSAADKRLKVVKAMKSAR